MYALSGLGSGSSMGTIKTCPLQIPVKKEENPMDVDQDNLPDLTLSGSYQQQPVVNHQSVARRISQLVEIFGEGSQDLYAHLKGQNIGRSSAFCVSDENKTVYVTNNHIIQLEEQVGSGSFSQVFSGVTKSTIRLTPDKCFAVKITTDKFDAENTLIYALTPNSKNNICLPIANYRIRSTINEDKFVRLYERCQCNFDSWEFEHSTTPFSDSLSLLRDIILGVKGIHKNDLIHGDLSAKNILLLENEGEIRAKLGDLATVKRENIKEPVVYTPRYADENIWKNSEEQFAQLGSLNKTTDVFSVGCIIHFNVIVKIFKHLNSMTEDLQLDDIYKKLLENTIKMGSSIDKEVLQKLREDNPGKRIYTYKNPENPKEIIVAIYPSPNEFREAAFQFFDYMCEKKMHPYSPVEIETGRKLVELCYDLLTTRSFDLVEDRLNQMIQLKKVESFSLLKRKISFESASPAKKRRIEQPKTLIQV